MTRLTGEVRIGTGRPRKRSASADMSAFFGNQAILLLRAILGYREPHQLAWALALGVLLGCVLQGNLVAVTILLFILSVRVNHVVVAVTAIAMALVTAKLDAQTHALGKYVLTHPDLAYHLSAAWQWPIVPWTDLNNTVVMGSLIFGLAALLPVFLLSYPIFHALAPPSCNWDEECSRSALSPIAGTNEQPRATGGIPAPLSSAMVERRLHERRDSSDWDVHTSSPPSSFTLPAADSAAVDAAFNDVAAADQAARQVTVDTRIEVVRMSPAAAASSARHATTAGARSTAELEAAAKDVSRQDPPMSEALNYLLRQLRDSRQRKAA